MLVVVAVTARVATSAVDLSGDGAHVVVDSKSGMADSVWLRSQSERQRLVHPRRHVWTLDTQTHIQTDRQTETCSSQTHEDKKMCTAWYSKGTPPRHSIIHRPLWNTVLIEVNRKCLDSDPQPTLCEILAVRDGLGTKC